MVSHQDVTDITAWQLAHKLNLRVDLFLLSPDFRRHFTRADRLSDVVSSAARNIAKGFGGDPRSFADHLRLAKGSQAEVLTYLNDAYHQRLITHDELQITRRLTWRAIKAASGLIRSLEATGSTGAGRPARRRNRLRNPPIPRGLG